VIPDEDVSNDQKIFEGRVVTLDVVAKNLAMTFGTTLSETLRIHKVVNDDEDWCLTQSSTPFHLFHVQTLLRQKLLRSC